MFTTMIAKQLRRAAGDGSLPAKVTVTSIILLAVLGGLEYRPPSPGVTFAFLLVSGIGIHLAGVFGEIIGQEFSLGRSIGETEFRTALVERKAVASLALWVFASAFFAAAAQGYLDPRTAFHASQFSLVALLFALGFLSRRLNGHTMAKCLWAGVAVAGTGFFLSDMRLLADFVKAQ